jgi:hypothetical protein
MRSLGQTRVLFQALLAALLSSILCLPRYLASPQHYPIWYLELVTLFGSFVLWAFVFAWHTQYTRRPVFTLNIQPALLIGATLLTALLALAFREWFDPIFRARFPRDYPATVAQWFSFTLYSLAFTQLFLVFAPLAWLMRLTRRLDYAVPMTILFGIAARALQDHNAHLQLSVGLSLGLWLLRCATALLGLWVYLRGGVLLTWWCALILQSRHLLETQP